MPAFGPLLSGGKVVLMDGAMGSELRRLGIPSSQCGEAWNLSHPDRIRAVHEAYVSAGARILLTNTFQANPELLGVHGLENQLEEICRRATELARSAAAPGGFVLGDIGP